jgi:hypothetical protein
MAELMVEEPGLRPTTAARRVLQSPSDADIRRLQVKWKASGRSRMEYARERRRLRDELRRDRATAAFRKRIKEDQERVAASVSAMLGLDSPALRLARELADSPATRLSREAYDSLASRAARELSDSPTMKAMREAYDSPAMKAVREAYDSPAMKAVREMYDSPALKAARELHDSAAMHLARKYQGF